MTERIMEPLWGRCVQGAVDAPWVVVVAVVVVVCCLSSSPHREAFWTNHVEAHGQLVLSPMRLPEQLRSSR